MILKKIQDENNKIYYEEISFDEALKLPRDTLVFTSEDEEEEFDEYLEYLEDELEELKENITININDLGKNLEKVGNFAINITNSVFRWINSRYNKENPKKTNYSKLTNILPFLDDKDVTDIVDEIISNEKLEDINIITIAPFLSSEDCDRLFMECVKLDNENTVVYGLLPFISNNCLDKFIEEYIQGKYNSINVDVLYPFLSSKAIKKLFKYIVSKK